MTADENKVFATCTCNYLQLDLFHYYQLVLTLVQAIQKGKAVHCYADIQMVCGCNKKSATRLWDCLDMIEKWQANELAIVSF